MNASSEIRSPESRASACRCSLRPRWCWRSSCLWAVPAQADFRLCNNTRAASASRSATRTRKAGPPRAGGTSRPRAARRCCAERSSHDYYYIYAIDYDRGGEWSGQAFMCSRDKEFTIRGTEDCLARGFDRTGFFEVDTGEQRAWTVQLTEAGEQNIQRPLPGLPGGASPSGGIPGGSPVSPPLTPARGAQEMRRLRRIKILATLGPASSDSAMIRKLFEAGADVFRINMSHTPHDKLREFVDDHPQHRKQLRPADRRAGRSAGTEAAHRLVRRRRDPAEQRRDLHARFQSRARRPQPRAAAASGNPAGAEAPATRCCSTTARCG